MTRWFQKLRPLAPNLLLNGRSKTFHFALYPCQERLGLTEHLGKRVSTYSKGMKRKLSLLIVIMMGRDILLMDEPTSGVDPISRVEIRSLIEALKADGKTVIITSHDLSEIEKCADDVSMIKNGRLLFDKGIQEMQGQSLEEIFIKEGNRHE